MWRCLILAPLALAAALPGGGGSRGHAAEAGPAVAEVLEDDAEGLLKQLNDPNGTGQGFVEGKEVFSGKRSIRIVPLQRFSTKLPGWNYRITEKPGPGEYRYLRFAWKARGCAGIMIQLHDVKTTWGNRYAAGIDRDNWGSTFVAPKPPAEWALVTRDLYRDFGERTITGLALTAFGGEAAYFDHIYFGRSVEGLDRVNVTGLSKDRPLALDAAALDRAWAELAAADASKAYLAFWRLTAAKGGVSFLAGKLAAVDAGVDAGRIRGWIRDLDDDAYAVREAASRRLERHLDVALPYLEKALRNRPGAEVRIRLQALLALPRHGAAPSPDRARIHGAVRVLEYVGTPEAKRTLRRVAAGPEGSRLAEAAKAALARLDAARK